MQPQPIANRHLQMEALETRVLLAGDGNDPFGLLADFNLAMLAVTGTGDFQASFSTNFGNHQLVLTGNEQASLSIDLDKLPDFITNLRISSFGSVTFSGSDDIENLVLNNIDSVAATDLSVIQSTHATDVDSLTIGSGGLMIVLKGTTTDLNARTIDNSTIISDLEALTLTSESENVLFISLNSEQTLNLRYLPEIVAITGIPESAVHIVLPPVDPVDPPPVDPGDPAEPGTTPDSPTTGGTGTEQPATEPSVTPATGKVVIISLPADERTQIFLAELRALLRSPSADAEQLVMNFLKQGNSAAATSNPLLAENSAWNNSSAVSQPGTFWGGVDNAMVGVNLMRGLASTESQQSMDEAPTLSSFDSTKEAPSYLPDNGVAAAPVKVDVSWAIDFREAIRDVGSQSTPYRTTEESVELSLEESVRALGSYLVQRVSAEFSPGQQSMVLLVDPKPTRTPGTARKTALDTFAAGGETILAGVPVIV